MKIYDISQEVFSCKVYPGDPVPERKVLQSMEEGSLYNLTAFSMCAHNGTHIDAPRHFIRDGAAVEELDISAFIGPVYVAHCDGKVTAADAERILNSASGDAAKRILIAGDAEVSLEAAQVFADAGILLLGVESQTVGPENAPMAVHLCLLGKGVVLLEGARLDGIARGEYFLSAAPLNLSGADGAPCRAVLIEGI